MSMVFNFKRSQFHRAKNFSDILYFAFSLYESLTFTTQIDQKIILLQAYIF